MTLFLRPVDVVVVIVVVAAAAVAVRVVVAVVVVSRRNIVFVNHKQNPTRNLRELSFAFSLLAVSMILHEQRRQRMTLEY